MMKGYKKLKEKKNRRKVKRTDPVMNTNKLPFGVKEMQMPLGGKCHCCETVDMILYKWKPATRPPKDQKLNTIYCKHCVDHINVTFCPLSS